MASSHASLTVTPSDDAPEISDTTPNTQVGSNDSFICNGTNAQLGLAPMAPSANTQQAPPSAHQTFTAGNGQNHLQALSVLIHQTKREMLELITRSIRTGTNRNQTIDNVETTYDSIALHITQLSDEMTKLSALHDTATQLGMGKPADILELHESVEDMLDILNCNKDSMIISLEQLKGTHDMLLDQMTSTSSLLGCSEWAHMNDTINELLSERNQLKLRVQSLTNNSASSNSTPFQLASNTVAQDNFGSAAVDDSSSAVPVSRPNTSANGTGQHANTLDLRIQNSIARASSRTNPSMNQHTNVQAQSQRTPRNQSTSNRSSVTSHHPIGTLSQFPMCPSALESNNDIQLTMWKSNLVQNLEKFSGSSDSMPLEKYLRLFFLRYPKVVWSDDELAAIFAENLSGVAKQHWLGIPKSYHATFDILIEEFNTRLNGEERLSRVHKLAQLQRLRFDPKQTLSSFIMEFEKLSAIAYKHTEDSERSFLMAQHMFTILSQSNWVGLDALLMILEDNNLSKYDRLKSHALMQERVRDNSKAFSDPRQPKYFSQSQPNPNKSLNNHDFTQKQCSFCQRRGHVYNECRTRLRQEANNTNQRHINIGFQPHPQIIPAINHRQNNERQPQRNYTTFSNTRNNNNNNAHNQYNNRQPNNNTSFVNNSNTYNRGNTQTQFNHTNVNNRVLSTSEPDIPTAGQPQDHDPNPNPFTARVAGWTSLQSMQTNDMQTCSTVGSRVTLPVKIFGNQTEALIDTGAQISTISARFIIDLVNSGVNVEHMVEELPLDQACQVFDASGNPMRFTMLLRTPVTTMPDGVIVNTVFHVVNGDSDEAILLGTNALPTMGIFLSYTSVTGSVTRILTPVVPQTNQEARVTPTAYQNASPSTCNTVVVRKRLVIPPKGTKMLDVSLTTGKALTGILWSTNEGSISSGLVSFSSDGSAKIPIHNNLSTTARFLKHQVVGHTDPDEFRWKAMSREDVVELLDHCPGRELLTDDARSSRLLDIILENNTVPHDIQKLIHEFSDVFAIDDFELKQTHLVSHDIHTGDATPIRQKARPIPMGARSKFKEILDNLLQKGIVEPSQSPWSSPIVLVTKRDGSLRLCVDYRELNRRIKLDSYPLPRMDDLLQSLNGKTVFSTLDLSAGFWQVPLNDEAKEKTAFATTEGLFQFKVLPFGLATSPATFQRLMATVLQDHIGQSNEVQVYIDDFLIATDTVERHIIVLKKVFEALRTANLSLKPQKCSLMKNQVTYLGHRIDASGVHPDPEKISAVMDFPRPSCVSELRSFLGLCGYYRKFVHRFGAIAKPLNELTSSSTAWDWNETRQTAFDTLKRTLCSSPVLAQPNFAGAQSGEFPFYLYTDACKLGVGAVLCQEGRDKFLHPIHFVSKSLNSAESKYTISDLEGLAVVHAVQRLRSYLYDMSVIVRTDHQPLVSFFKNNTYGRVVRWALALQSYNRLRIEYVQGKSNIVADALSRGSPVREKGDDSPTCQGQPECALLALQAGNDNNTRASWIDLIRSDPDFSELIANVQTKSPPTAHKLKGMNTKVETTQFSINSNHLWFQTKSGDIRKVVPKEHRKTLYLEAHAGTLAGHFGPAKIITGLQRNYFWPGLAGDVYRWHSECTQCYLSNNHDINTPPLKPILRGKPYELIAVDLLELGNTSNGNRYALVIVDHFSKFLGAYPIPNKNAETVAETLVSRWICEGARWPKEILSDKGTEFLNQITEHICKVTGIAWITTKGYNPRENGLVERANATIKNALKKKVESPTEWDKLLPFVVFAYNTSPHDATGESPFFLLHAFDPPSVASIDPPELSLWLADNVDYRTALVEGIQSAHALAEEKLLHESNKMKHHYDRDKSVDKSWFPYVGDRVFLKNAPGTRSAHPKLTSGFSGPYRVIERSDNSCLIVDIKGLHEPVRIPFDRLIKTPDTINDDIVGNAIRKRGRPNKIQCNCLTVSAFRPPRNTSKHLNLISPSDPINPGHTCAGGPVKTPLCTTILPPCPFVTMSLKQLGVETTDAAGSFQPGNVLRLAQAMGAANYYGLTPQADDQTVTPTLPLITKDLLTNAFVLGARYCNHIKLAIKAVSEPKGIFALVAWKLADSDVWDALTQAAATIAKDSAPPNKTIMVTSAGIKPWAGHVAFDSFSIISTDSVANKIIDLLTDPKLAVFVVNVIAVFDGEIPQDFVLASVLPTTKRTNPFRLHISCGPLDTGHSNEWYDFIKSSVESVTQRAVNRNGTATTVTGIQDVWCAATVLGRNPGPATRFLPAHRVLAFFTQLAKDSGFPSVPIVMLDKAIGSKRSYDYRKPQQFDRNHGFQQFNGVPAQAATHAQPTNQFTEKQKFNNFDKST